MSNAALTDVHAPENIMSQTNTNTDLRDTDLRDTDLRGELRNAPVEPLLPVEKKLIAWSLGLGIGLLAVLAVINHFAPAQF
jgi:hypothetical protein